MVFQVIVPKSRRELQCGSIRVEFVARRPMLDTPVTERNTQTGTIRVATPEATALEVVGYPERCGYLDNVATVLAELSESMSGDLLAAEARRAPTAWVQRLGYLLELVQETDLADCLDPLLAERTTFPVALAPWKEMNGTRRASRWRRRGERPRGARRMIPRAYITEWRAVAPWIADSQVEQDLVISRALVTMFGASEVAERLAVRGGAALNKLHFRPPARYSEDIDLVQVRQV